MTIPIVAVSREKEEVSTDLKSTIEDVSTRLQDLKSTIEAVSTDQKDLKSTAGEVSTHMEDLISVIEEVSTHQKDLKSTIEQVSTDQKDLKSSAEDVSAHLKDLKSAIEQVSAHLKELNSPLKMTTPTEEVSREKEGVCTHPKSTIEEVSREKGEASSDLKSAIEEVSTRLKDLKSTIEQFSTDQKDLKSTAEEVSTHIEDLKSAIEEVSTHQNDLKSAIQEVFIHQKDLKSTTEEVSAHLKDLKSAIEEVSTHLKESNPPLKMSTPTEEVSREKEEVSTDLNSSIKEVSTHLKKSNEDWISIMSKLVECLDEFCDHHFPSTTEQKISDIKLQIEKKELSHERAMFEYIKGRIFNAIPDVYKEEAEYHLVNATQLNPLLLEAWDCLGCCFSKKGEYQRAKKCYKFVLHMAAENSIILRRIAYLELKFAQGWYYNTLLLALEALEEAKKIDAMKSNPYFDYDYSRVNRFVENYKGSLIGFSDAALKNPASDASHQVKLTLELLDKLERLLKGKGKSTETSLPDRIQSLANIDLNPSYKRATMDLLTEGLNEQIEVVAVVRCLVEYGYIGPLYYMLCDSDEKSFVLTMFGIQKEAIKQGDQVTLLEPICKFIDFEWEGKHYQFKSVRVNFLKQVLVNGNALSPNFAMPESM
uniref:Tetratricopeptide repeat protein 5 OB fold domain-containing protein n=1 Tax=Solanum lycopersicum TaxID=4081 RepID=A0A3Q7EZK2_SOLLC